jgi:hypothetical protein
VTFGSHPNTVKAFSFFFLATVYFIPLVVMIVAYTRILVTILCPLRFFSLLDKPPKGLQVFFQFITLFALGLTQKWDLPFCQFFV